MKTNILSIALSFMTIVAVAQKKEIRDAGKALDKGSYAEAKTLLSQAEPMLNDVNAKGQQEFYIYKGQAYLGAGENASTKDLLAAAEAYKKAKELGSDEADQGITAVRNALVQSAIKDQNAENYKSAMEKLYTTYEMNPQDTLYLYYAASNAINAKDYDSAIDYYSQLKDMGYTGIEMEYSAINKETGEEEFFSKAQRDIYVKTGEYTTPQDKKTISKAGEIAKNMALILVSQNKEDEAIAAMEDAKNANPDDIALLQAEADMYYRMGQKDKYKQLMENIIAKNPNDAVLYYNLGVTSAELEDTKTAVNYYKKALEIDPNMTDARLNIAAAILAQESGLVEQMNSLGTSKADNAKYDQLAEQRKEIYREALPYLEEVMKNNPENIDAMRTTMNIYYQLGQNEKAAELEAKINN